MRYFYDTELAITLQDFSCPRNSVFDALSLRLSNNPQFKVLRCIVQFVTIYVMNVFTWQQIATKFLFHDIAMFEHMSPAWNDYALVSTRCEVRAFHFSNMPVFLRVTRAYFSEFLDLLVVRHAITLCPQWLIAIRNLATWTFGVLRRSPKQIASLAQSTLHIGYFSSTLRGRTQSINLFRTLEFIVATAEFCSHIRDWVFAVINNAKGNILRYDSIHGTSPSSHVSSRLRSVSSTRGGTTLLPPHYSIKPLAAQA
jgi:hypothetical protein